MRLLETLAKASDQIEKIAKERNVTIEEAMEIIEQEYKKKKAKRKPKKKESTATVLAKLDTFIQSRKGNSNE